MVKKLNSTFKEREMSVEKYMYHANTKMFEQLLADPVFPLVRELNHAFGFKVIGVKSPMFYGGSAGPTYMMCDDRGFAVGTAYTTRDGGRERDQLEYRFHTPYIIKERGKTRTDKETHRSTKVSVLVKTLKKFKDELTQLPMREYVHAQSLALRVLHNSLGDDAKSHGLSVEDVHALLATVMKDVPTAKKWTLDLNKCQEVLDKLEAADILKENKRKEKERFFTKPFYAVCVDTMGEVVMAKLRKSSLKDDLVEIIQPFRRYHSEVQSPEILPIMTMIKVFFEDEENRRRAGHSSLLMWAGKVPMIDSYVEPLDVAFARRTMDARDPYKGVWFFTPADDGVAA